MKISSSGLAGLTVVDANSSTTQDLKDRSAIVKAKAKLEAVGYFGQNRELSFQVERGTHRVVITVVNTDTNEVLEQLPSEQVLRMAAALGKAG